MKIKTQGIDVLLNNYIYGAKKYKWKMKDMFTGQ